MTSLHQAISVFGSVMRSFLRFACDPRATALEEPVVEVLERDRDHTVVVADHEVAGAQLDAAAADRTADVTRPHGPARRDPAAAHRKAAVTQIDAVAHAAVDDHGDDAALARDP